MRHPSPHPVSGTPDAARPQWWLHLPGRIRFGVSPGCRSLILAVRFGIGFAVGPEAQCRASENECRVEVVWDPTTDEFGSILGRGCLPTGWRCDLMDGRGPTG